jgi:UDP-N-acetylmuramate--alanine ligase
MTPEKRHIHFVGIGGIGMSGIAHLAHKNGAVVSGSDVRASAVTRKLENMGIRIFIGHEACHVDAAELVVYSSAIASDNPEMTAARTRRVPVLKRAEFLSELMKDKTVVTVTGAHGKTTTSSLAAKLLMSAGLCPSVAVGGILREDGDNAKAGESSYFVAEADESDGTFLCYTPTYSIITNIDQEHMDFYKTYDNLLGAFAKFISQTRPGGRVIYCREDPVLTRCVVESGVAGLGYGWGSEADVRAEEVHCGHCRLSFKVFAGVASLGAFQLSLMGRHNVLNALAVIALGRELGIGLDVIQKALADFRGVERRFQIKRDDEGLMVVDDYGHHPTEIAATIQAARVCGRRRLVVVFQPHRYTRTHLLMDRFAESFAGCDRLFITDIYSANEAPVLGVDAPALVERIRMQSPLSVAYAPKVSLLERLSSEVRPGDLVLFLGAGDITRMSDEFAANARV